MLTPKMQVSPLIAASTLALCLALAPSQVEAQACAGALPSAGALSISTHAEDGVCDSFWGESISRSVDDCADHSTQLTAYYAQAVTCGRTNIYTPSSIAEAQQMIRGSVSSGRHVRIAGEGHSNTDIICGDNTAGNADIISTELLHGVGAVTTFEGVPTIRIEAGASFNDLQAAANSAGYSIGMNAPGYGPIHVLGGLATGLHGASPTGVSSISARIVSLEVIGANGNITTYTRGTKGAPGSNSAEDWAALNANLGGLGMIAAARIEVEPQFNLDTTIIRVNGPAFFANPNSYMNPCDFAFTNWFPHEDKVLITCGIRTTAPADPTAYNGLFSPALTSDQTSQAVPGFQAGVCSLLVNELIENQRLAQTTDWLYTFPGGVETPTNHVVGLSHKIVTIHNFRATQPKFSSTDFEIALPETSGLAALQEIRRQFMAQGYALPSIGVVIRYDRATNDTILGGNAVRPGVTVGTRIMHIEFPTFYPYETTPAELANFNAPIISIMGQFIDTYPTAHFHWGKNDEWMFADPEYKANNASRRARFQAVINRLDPYGVFSNNFMRNAGFSWPQEGQNFAAAYYPSCGTAAGLADADNDGMRACTEATLGSSASTQNGAYLRVGGYSILNGADLSGGCHNYDNWSEVASFDRFGSHWLWGTAVRESRPVSSGWEFDVPETANRNYNSASYNFFPSLTSGGTDAFALMFSANMNFAAGTYCFSNDSEAPGTAQDTGWNSCAQTWIDKTLRTEVGYNASPRVVSSCVTLTAGSHRLDWITRFNPAFNTNSYASHPRWCQVTSGTSCTPNREFERYQLTPNSTSL